MSHGEDSPRYNGDHSLCLSVVYRDEHLLELAVRLKAGDWAGLTRTYISGDAGELRQLADQLAAFIESPTGEVPFETGYANILVLFRFFTYGGARRLACQVRLEYDDMDSANQTQSVNKLDVEVKTESCFLARFVEELMTLADTQTGSATLVLE